MAGRCHHAPPDHSPGLALRIVGPLRPVDGSNHRDASGGPDDQADRGAAQRGRLSHAAIAEGVHEHLGAEAVVAWRTDSGKDPDEATRPPRVVAAGLGPGAPDVSEQAAGLGPARLGPRPPGPAARSLGRLGRRAGTAAVAAAPGGLETRPACGRSPVSRVGHPLMNPDPIGPYGAGRWDRGFVTREALCRADPDLPRPSETGAV